jgi:hypothetical protein
VKIGIVANTFAFEEENLDNALARWAQVAQVGADFMAGNLSWSELEPTQGQWDMGAAVLAKDVAYLHGMDLEICLRLVDAVQRNVGPGLATEPWNSSVFLARANALLDNLIPHLLTAKYVTLAYEPWSYFNSRQGEIQAFAELFLALKIRLKAIYPQIQVGITASYPELAQLWGPLSVLNVLSDYLSVNYGPYNTDFTIKPIASIASDFQFIKAYAAGRPIVFHEIACPSAAICNSSEAKQGRFINAMCDIFGSETVAAASFMALGDLSIAKVEALAQYFQITTPEFKAAIQTTGLFNACGSEKLAWRNFVANISEF